MEKIDYGENLFTEYRAGENIMYVKLSNAKTPEEVLKFRDFLEKSHDLTVVAYNDTGKQVLGLIDLRNFTHYSPEVISIISSVLKKNKPYVERTATFGGTPFIKLAQDTVYALAGRDNFRAFEKEEEAVSWLLTQKA